MLNKLGVLIFDCWSDPYTKTHYMGLFVAIKHPTAKDKYGRSVAKFFLLALAPPQDETSFNARIWEEFIRTTCATYHINLADILYACSDNTALCPAIARLLKIFFIGCASHRFQLAVNQFAERTLNFLSDMDRLNELMKSMKTLKQVSFIVTIYYPNISNLCMVA